MNGFLKWTLLAMVAGAVKAQELNLVPKPVRAEVLAGKNLVFEKGEKLKVWVAPEWQKEVKQQVKRWEGEWKRLGFGWKRSKEEGANVVIDFCDTVKAEGYVLQMEQQGGRKVVKVAAGDAAGVYYALQSVDQLTGADRAKKGERLEARAVRIYDAPRFKWRGFMLDEGRHFFGVKEVKRVLDVMAHYKMNRFHWHLTEDQGWRLAIKGYPKLTEVGAWRRSKALPWGKWKEDGIRYGGFYTPKEVKEIVRYAKERCIEIVPEIDMPGHFQAAVASYPELLACDPKAKHEVWVGQGVSRDVMNVANPKAMKLVYAIVDELVRLFPYDYIHLGGDECPTMAWKNTPECRALLDSLGSTNFHDLQTHFYAKIAEYVAKKPKGERKKLVFWNEVLSGNMKVLPKDVTIMAWIGWDAAALKAAKMGYDAILSPQIPYYINRKQSRNEGEPHTQGGGNETLEAVYAYAPAKDVPKELLPKYLGVQANFWSEWVDNGKLLEYLMLPRLAAVAEAGWTPEGKRNYQDFLKRMRGERAYYKAKGYDFGKAALGDETDEGKGMGE